MPQAEPDGYTVLMHHIGMSTAPALYADLPYDPLEDFKTIGLVTEVPMTIIARKDFEPSTLQELVNYVKANADKVTYANAGIGAASHLCGLLFQKAVGVKLQEVPYEGTGPALTDLVGGQVDFMCDQTTNTTGQIKARRGQGLRGDDAGAHREPARPADHRRGRPRDLQVTVWHGLYVPADTPDEVVQTLTEALQVALADQGVIDKLAELGTAPVRGGPGDAGGATASSWRSRSASGARSSRKRASRLRSRTSSGGRPAGRPPPSTAAG